MQKIESSKQRWVTVSMLWLTHTFSYLNYGALGTLAPFIKDDLNLTSSQIGLLISIASVGFIFIQWPAGVFVEIIGIRKILSGGVVAAGLSAILLSRSYSFWSALSALLFFGFAIGSISPAGIKTVIGLFPPGGRASAMAIKQTGINMGYILAGILMPTSAILFSWRNSLFIVGVAEIVSALLIYRFCVDPWQGTDHSLPLFHFLRKFKTIVFRKDILLVGGIGMFLIAIQFCFSTYMVLFLMEQMHFPVQLAGSYFTVAFLAGAFARIGWSALSDYILLGKRKPILFMITFLLAGICFLLSWVSSSNSPRWVILSLTIIFGLTGIGWNALWLTMIGEIINRDSSGMTAAGALFIGNLGSLLGPPLFGYIVDITQSFTFAWLFLGVSAMAAVGLLGLLEEKKAQP